MSLPLNELVFLTIGFFFIATLYSSIGFGGGSSYLALLALFLAGFFSIRSVALLCNLVVVSGSCYMYYKNRLLNFKRYLPFVITSIPMAFLGAVFKMEEQVFFGILGVALILSSVFLCWQTLTKNQGDVKKNYPAYIPYVIGAAIGLLSGMVGIGGGIFLAPVLHHIKWDRPFKIAALASFFILVNSISGIAGLLVNETFIFPGTETLFLAAAVFLGGQVGIRLSLKKLTGTGIKLITAFLVLMVGIKVLLINGYHLKF